MIDWNRVAELRHEIGDDAFEEVVALFLDEADAVVARLSAKMGPKSLENDCHFLKGAALNLGFATLAKQCQAGETRAATGDVDIDLMALRDSYLQSRSALLQGPLNQKLG